MQTFCSKLSLAPPVVVHCDGYLQTPNLREYIR